MDEVQFWSNYVLQTRPPTRGEGSVGPLGSVCDSDGGSMDGAKEERAEEAWKDFPNLEASSLASSFKNEVASISSGKSSLKKAICLLEGSIQESIQRRNDRISVPPILSRFSLWRPFRNLVFSPQWRPTQVTYCSS